MTLQPANGRHYVNLIEALVGDFDNSHLPERFRRWAAISAIAGAMGKRTWYEFKNKKGGIAFSVPPNMFITLIGDPGVGKSAAIYVPYIKTFKKLAEIPGTDKKDWKREWEQYRMARPFWLLSDRITAERLSIDMKACQTVIPELTTIESGVFIETPLTLVTSELGSLMEKFDKQIQLFLTDSWDAKDEYSYRTKTAGVILLKEPCLNWLACSTPEEFVNYLPKSAKAQGLLSRMIIVPYYGPKCIDDIEYEAPDDNEIECMKADLAQVSKIRGSFTFSDEEFYQEVRQWIRAGGAPRPTEYKLQEYNNRRKVHLIKLAMVVSAACRSDRKITRDDWDYAKTVLFDAENDMPTALRLFGTSETGKMVIELQEIINEVGSMNLADFVKLILERIRSSSERDSLFEAMIAAKMIKIIGNKVHKVESGTH